MSHIRSCKHNSAHIAAMVAATFSIAASAADDVSELPEVSVKTAKEVPFKADVSASEKFTKPLIDTTQTVQVIKKELLREQGVFSLTDALRNTPGITIQFGEGGNSSAGDTFSMRGFNASNQLFVDGIRDLGAVSRDVYNLEQVEVVKGPAGADIGRGAASGYINLISKLPSLTDANFAIVGYGTAEKMRGTIDVNKKIGDTTAVRINALGFDGNVDKRDEVDNQNFSIAPSIGFGLGTDTRLFIYSQHVRHDNTNDAGIPSIGLSGFFNANANIRAGRKVDRENFYGSDRDFEKVDADMITAKFEHDVNDNTTLRNISRYGRTDLDRITTGVGGITASSADPSTWTVARSRQRVDRQDEIMVNQTSLNSLFDVAGFKNSFVGGVELIYERQKNKSFAVTGLTNPNANLYNPNQNDVLPIPFATGAATDGNAKTAAIYAFDTVDLNEQWQVNGGFRYERYKIATESTAAATAGGATTRASDADNLLSWKAGVLFKPATNGSIYAAYATSYTPPGSANFALSATANNQNNSTLDPQKTDNIEIGTKWDLLNNHLNVTAAIFSSENDNQTSFDDLLQPAQIGKTRVSGYELLAVGKLTEYWQLSAGLTKLNAKELDQRSNVGVDTTAVRWTPDYSATLWTQYDFGGFTIGGGARYMGEQKRLVTTANPATTNMPVIPSFVVADAMIAYEVNENLDLRLNVYNLFDREYIETMSTNGLRVRLGLPRTAMFTAEMKF